MLYFYKDSKPSKELIRLLKEADYMIKHPDEYESYSNMDDLFKALDSDN